MRLILPGRGFAWLCLFAIAVVIRGQSAYAAEKIPEFSITGSEVRTIDSSVLGRRYELYVKLPPSYSSASESQRRYPVIYFNDGGYCWLTAVGATRPPFNFGGYEEAILVGLSYAHGESATASRVRDFTPTADDGWELETGGAKTYLDFIKREVIPFIEQHYRADPARRTLVGQSLGGLFGVFALLEEPGLFHDYILTSASLWFDDEAVFDLELVAADTGRVLSGRVYFAVGETETPAINAGRHDMVGQQRRFAERLRSRGYDGLIVRDEVLEGGTHLTTYPIGFLRAMRWQMSGPDIYNGGSR